MSLVQSGVESLNGCRCMRLCSSGRFPLPLVQRCEGISHVSFAPSGCLPWPFPSGAMRFENRIELNFWTCHPLLPLENCIGW